MRNKGRVITKDCEYILNGVELYQGTPIGGNGYCFDNKNLQVLFVEQVADVLQITVEAQFESKKDYIYEKI